MKKITLPSFARISENKFKKLVEGLPEESGMFSPDKSWGKRKPDGQPVGLWVTAQKVWAGYKLKRVTYFDENSKTHGDCATYGYHTLQNILTYEHGEIVCKKYFGEGGRIQSLGEYKGSVLHGKLIRFNPNDTIEGRYKNGVRHGSFKFWYVEGNKKILAESCRYKNGQLDGLYTHYWENGQVRCRVPLKEGKVDGVVTYWNKDGTVVEKRRYKADCLIRRTEIIEDLAIDIMPNIKHLRLKSEIFNMLSLKSFDTLLISGSEHKRQQLKRLARKEMSLFNPANSDFQLANSYLNSLLPEDVGE